MKQSRCFAKFPLEPNLAVSDVLLLFILNETAHLTCLATGTLMLHPRMMRPYMIHPLYKASPCTRHPLYDASLVPRLPCT
jgi:hypothetical protein